MAVFKDLWRLVAVIFIIFALFTPFFLQHIRRQLSKGMGEG